MEAKVKNRPAAGRYAAVIGARSGLVAGVIVSALMTYPDWRLNPGGIFRDANGTDWAVVGQTAWSWFWPVALLSTALVTTVTWLWLRHKEKEHEAGAD